jgi:hypothetical protein
VYELGADVCLRAHDFGEFLKCQQLLLHHIYPALEADGWVPTTHWTTSGGTTAPLTRHYRRHRAAPRWAEFAATGVLYFPCVRAVCGTLEMACTLRAIPPRLLTSPPVQRAFCVVVALLAGDYQAFLRLCAARPDRVGYIAELVSQCSATGYVHAFVPVAVPLSAADRPAAR